MAAADAICWAVANCLWRLGPVFVKLGQVLSTRPDLLDARLCAALRSSLAFGVDRRGVDAGDCIFVAAGSVADLYRVRRNGQDLAVKILRPGVTRTLQIDLTVVESAVRLLARLFPCFKGVPPIVAELSAAVRQQVDLGAERDRLVAMSALESTCNVVLPRPIPGLCTPERLVMTWLPGQGVKVDSQVTRGLAKELLRTVFEMLFVTGIVHCDLHPGNWWARIDGRIAIVDAGFSWKLEPEMQAHFREFFLGMATNDGNLCATHALAVTGKPLSDQAARAFRSDLCELVGKVHGMSSAEFSLTAFAKDFFAIQRTHGAISDPAFVFPIVALLSIEGQIRALDPEIDFQAVALPVLLRSFLT